MLKNQSDILVHLLHYTALVTPNLKRFVGDAEVEASTCLNVPISVHFDVKYFHRSIDFLQSSNLCSLSALIFLYLAHDDFFLTPFDSIFRF
jgi:hypothetical protein